MAVKVIEQESDRVVFEIDGALDRDTVPGVRKTLIKIVGRKKTRRVDIAARGITTMDTAGVALLVELVRILEKKSGVLRLRGLNDGAVRLIQLARLDTVLGTGTGE